MADWNRWTHANSKKIIWFIILQETNVDVSPNLKTESTASYGTLRF